jgi:hypothetical protein
MTSGSAPANNRWLRTFTLTIPLLYGLALIVFARRVGTSDYDQFLVFHELQYWNVTLFGLAKQWSPVMCSGLSLAGEPQVPFASLTMLAAYILGPLTGIVVGTACYLAIGWVGAFAYSGLWFRQPGLRALAASLFIGNGFFICRIAHGHNDFVPFLALPLALWLIHYAADQTDPRPHGAGPMLTVLLLGSLFAVVVDGSPVAIIHWLFWIGIYTATLSWVRRSILPALAFATACAIAATLDAGYLWPMISAQADFPRHTADTFTGPWSLPWFMLIPMRGKLLPANGTGIELSVFIGPFLGYLIWRYRKTLRSEMPREVRLPLLVVSVTSIWLGMGSLHAAHIPVWLSPFDWLRPLPGFRSIGITGRFWGFLALPLSLLAAAALWRHIDIAPASRRKVALIGAAFLTQLTFQGESLIAAWSPSRVYEPVSLQGMYMGSPEHIQGIRNPNSATDPHLQGEFISPVRAVTNCYDMDDFTRTNVGVGASLIKDSHLSGAGKTSRVPLEAGFLDWNRIRIEAPLLPASAATADPDTVVRVVLNQAYHSGWTSAYCTVERGGEGNLIASCPERVLRTRPIDLVFFDRISDLGMRVSVRAASVLGTAMVLLGLMSLTPKRRIAPVTGNAAS